MLRYHELLAIEFPEARIAWTDHEVMLHALAVGMGRTPGSERELPYVYERDLQVLPSLIAVLEKRSAFERLQLMQIDLAAVLHGGQRIVVHAPLSPRAELVGTPRIVEAYDKGDKGAVILEEIEFRDAASGELVATSHSTMIVRGAGHFGGSPGGVRPADPPTEAPDAEGMLSVRPEQAALFRLLGDRNPLHIDPAVAALAGFPQPILHGLSTLGMAAQCILAAVPGREVRDFVEFGASFAGYVLPGDNVAVSMWLEGARTRFVARTCERDTLVLRDGLAVFR